MVASLSLVKRRAFLKSGLAAVALWQAGGVSTQAAATSIETVAEEAHQEIWRRFIDKRLDVLFHYAGLNGEVTLPTADHCAAAQPNGMSWSTPIEDGPFFGGLYLDGLCNRWSVRRDEESAEKAHRIAAGLMKLAERSETPGFVPRGLGADGKSHYPASSEDQVFPWFYGLWCYVRSGLVSGSERTRIVEKLQSTAVALEGHQWRVPCARPEYGYRGTFVRPTAHDAARFLFLLRAMHQLTGEERWLTQYHERLQEKVGPTMKSRLEICAEGLEYGGHGKGETYLWTHSMSQAALRALADAEADAATREAYRQGLTASVERAATHLERAGKYDSANQFAFDTDWRFLNASWKPQANCEEAIALGRAQLPLWADRNPRSPYEDDTVREPLFAAWIICLAGKDVQERLLGPKLQEMLTRYQWRGMYTATFFIAVNLAYEHGRMLR
ncbi:hypothetical protein DES53_106349 [Roseimicrobium gellanilyticum]|uniref:Uncharacterized protein n=1 Tax=Roseimicrobium gellanilyticum TaxID=748857 RepID=A0A366HKJ0_9BACT|nr:hypothetical protein [Roseimicrobium gellanilyticum]RBP42640.1 hypothetical protein DES53_106349 [Roseimicrobium gellanilyticum]